MEKERLEEAAERISKEHYVDQSDYWAIGVDSFKNGAKWMEEQMEKLKDFEVWKEWKNTGVIKSE